MTGPRRKHPGAGDADWRTLRELDERAGRLKGSAFRAFRAIEPALLEGEDFRVLHPERDAARIEALRAAARCYLSSRSVVLLSAATAGRVLAALRTRV